MAVAFDAVGPSSAGFGAAGTSGSWSHTCSGSNRVLVVGVAFGLSGSTTTATYNGVSMTSLGKIDSNNDSSGYVQLFGLVNPPSGTFTVAIATTASGDITAGSISFTGASGFGTAVTAAGTATPTVTVTGTTSGNMVVDAVCNGASVTSSNQTQRWLKNQNTFTAAGNAAGSTAAAGGSVTMSYTVSSDWWGIVAVEVLAATAAQTAQFMPFFM